MTANSGSERRPRGAGASGADDAVPIADLLREAGFDTPSAKAAARGVLERARLTRPGKNAIAAFKRDAALALLAQSLARVCGKECAALAARGRAAVITSGATCEVCGGSNNRRAGLAALRVLRAHRVRNLLVVGGTVHQHREIEALFGAGGVAVQCIDGTRASHSQKEAIANMARADLLVVWGSTPLRHAVSNLYTSETPPHLRVIPVARRGIEALCREISESYRRTASARRR